MDLITTGIPNALHALDRNKVVCASDEVWDKSLQKRQSEINAAVGKVVGASSASDIATTNTVYRIANDINLNGGTLVLPEGTTLLYGGGSIKNGTLDCSKAKNVDECLLGLLDSSLTLVNPSFMRPVNYRMFGAKLDGVTDDYAAVKACHDFANKYNVDVKQTDGTIYIATGQMNYQSMDYAPVASEPAVVVRTNTDLSGARMLVYGAASEGAHGGSASTYKNSRKNKYLILEDEDNYFEEVTMTDAIKSALIKGRVANSGLTETKYENGFYMARSNASTDPIGYRAMDVNYPQERCEPFTIISDGNFADGRLYNDYTETTTTKIYRKSTGTRPITFKAPVLVYDAQNQNEAYTRPAICVCRNNVTMEMQQVETKNVGNYTDANAWALVSFMNCMNVHISGEKGTNVGDRAEHSAQTTSYMFNCELVSFLYVENCYLQKGWGVWETTNCKEVHVNQCVLNRVDNHWGCGNFYVHDTKIVGDKNFINIGYGMGNVVIRDCDWVLRPTSYAPSGKWNMVHYRGDLGLMFEGNVLVENMNVQVRTGIGYGEYFSLAYTYTRNGGTGGAGMPFTTENRVGSLTFRNINIWSNVVLAVYGFDLHPNIKYYLDKFEVDGLHYRTWNGEWVTPNVIAYITNKFEEIGLMRYKDVEFHSDYCPNHATMGNSIYTNTINGIKKIEIIDSIFHVPFNYYMINSGAEIYAQNSELYIMKGGKYVGCKLFPNSVSPSSWQPKSEYHTDATTGQVVVDKAGDAYSTLGLQMVTLQDTELIDCVFETMPPLRGVCKWQYNPDYGKTIPAKALHFYFVANDTTYAKIENFSSHNTRLGKGEQIDASQYEWWRDVLKEYHYEASVADRTAGSTRPAVRGAISKGRMFFDTSIGKPIWWDGTQWVDFEGTAVDEASVQTLSDDYEEPVIVENNE